MRVAVVFGTRPEAIKMAPVIRALRAAPPIDCQVWSTGQHRQMLDQVLLQFDLELDVDLQLMTPGQGLNGFAASALIGIDRWLAERAPDLVLVHGDTTTAMAGATAAFHRGVPVGHVEAGLRSGRMDQPWPEEFNRRAIDLVSRLLFAPTEGAREALLAEGVDPRRVQVTGNTVVDALLLILERVRRPETQARLQARFSFLSRDRPLVLVTGHRRESFGTGFEDLCLALGRLADRGMEVVYPVHLNPNVRGPVHALLGSSSGVHLIEPLDYEAFVYLMDCCDVILTDSGGVQEEAPSLGKPVLITRQVTERPEAVATGLSNLVGTDPERIVQGVLNALDTPPRATVVNPYGDGRASARILQGLLDAADDLR